MGREGGGGEGKVVILSTFTSTRIPNYKTSKQAIRQGKLRKITKCLLTRDRYIFTITERILAR